MLNSITTMLNFNAILCRVCKDSLKVRMKMAQKKERQGISSPTKERIKNRWTETKSMVSSKVKLKPVS